jgi:hypothetical protein
MPFLRLADRRAPLLGALVLALASISFPAAGQQAPSAAGPAESEDPLLAGRPWVSPFAPLRLSTPNAYREGDGTPGPEYWQ